MGLISIVDLQDDTDADANDINSRNAIIAGVINGNLDDQNLANGAVTQAKLASSSVSKDKLALSVTQDANGWKVYDFGTWKEYSRRLTSEIGSIAGGAYTSAGTINFPVGKDNTTAIRLVTFSFGGNAPFFVMSVEGNTLYIRNVSAGSVDPGTIYIDMFARDI